MRTEPVLLRHLRAGPAVYVSLSEPTGHDDLAVDGVDTRAAVELLSRLLEGSAVDASHLAASDRDALFAALHRQCWGDRILSTLVCTACARPFDLSFELSALERSLASAGERWPRDAEGRITDRDGRSVGVPNAADELAAAALGRPAALGTLLEAAGVSADHMASAAEALEGAAPIIDLELDAECADCGHHQQAHFDLQSFLLQRVINERESLLGEVHVLAALYGWSLDDILALPRATRRSFAAMARASLHGQSGAVRRGGRA
jgi:hypothetical protein